MSKIRFLLSVLLCFISAAHAFSQTGTIFFDDKWKKVESREGASFFRIVTYHEAGYKVVDYYINGDKQMVGYYMIGAKKLLAASDDDDGYRDGYFDYYYPNGKKSSEGQYKNGNKEGEWRYYDSLGKMYAKEAYQKGLRHGEFISYYSNGKVQERKLYKENHLEESREYDESGKEVKPMVYKYVEQMPTPGYDIGKFIGENLIYPKEAIEYNIEGRSIIQFVVDVDGRITDVRPVSRFNPACDDEAVRVISMMPAWKPGMQKGKPVRVYYTLPLVFKLQDEDPKEQPNSEGKK
jgi:TonB family protein